MSAAQEIWNLRDLRNIKAVLWEVSLRDKSTLRLYAHLVEGTIKHYVVHNATQNLSTDTKLYIGDNLADAILAFNLATD